MGVVIVTLRDLSETLRSDSAHWFFRLCGDVVGLRLRTISDRRSVEFQPKAFLSLSEHAA